MDTEQHRNASYVAQGLVSGYDRSHYIDGKWGSFSQSRYNALTPARRAAIDAALRLASMPSVAELFAYRSKQKNASSSVSDKDDIRAIVRAAADEFGIDRALMLATIDTESNFNPNATNGSSRGLGQFQPAAWDEVRQKVIRDLPPYDVGWSQPKANARATAAYFRLNSQRVGARLSKIGVRVEPWMLYMAHQQGSAGFSSLMELAKTGGKPTDIQQTRMVKNPPQDGKGATASPSEFIDRWSKVVKAKLAKYS